MNLFFSMSIARVFELYTYHMALSLLIEIIGTKQCCPFSKILFTQYSYNFKSIRESMVSARSFGFAAWSAEKSGQFLNEFFAESLYMWNTSILNTFLFECFFSLFLDMLLAIICLSVHLFFFVGLIAISMLCQCNRYVIPVFYFYQLSYI